MMKRQPKQSKGMRLKGWSVWLPTAALLCACLLLFVACNDDDSLPNLPIGDEDNSETDGDFSVDGDTDNEAEEDEEVELGIVTLKGTSNEGGNAITVFMTFFAHSPLPSIIWNRVELQMGQTYLADSPECTANQGETLTSDRGKFTLSLLGQSELKLKMIIPAEREFCSMKFSTAEKAFLFIAEGQAYDGRTIKIETDLGGALPFNPPSGSYRFEGGTEANWVAAMPMNRMLTVDQFSQLNSDEQGNITIDKDHNSEHLTAINQAIVDSFILVNDQNANGIADPDEMNDDNVVGYEPPDPPIDGDAEVDIETEDDADAFDPNDPDSDGVLNGTDNCPIDYNPLQENDDNDDLGNACDNCPEDDNQDQRDIDDDTIGDVCDNCPIYANVEQKDYDNDNIGDECDPDPYLADLCVDVPCWPFLPDEANSCVLFGMTCEGGSLIERGICSKDCESGDWTDCPPPFTCIDGKCGCHSGK